jgi:zinc protease
MNCGVWRLALGAWRGSRATIVLASAGVLAAAGSSRAQSAARLPAPPPGATTATADTLTSEFTTHGLRVILRRNPANDVVAANLYLLGGSRQITPQNAGIEAMILFASERGTRHYSRDALRAAMARTGSTIAIDPGDDWTVFGFRGIRSTFDSTWYVFADRLMAATLAPADVDWAREQMLSGVRQRPDIPDALVESLAESTAFAGHPYALSTVGDERSLTSLTPAMLKAFRAAQFVTSRMLLVVVGNVERPRIEALVARTLGTLPAGSYRWTLPPPLPHSASTAVLVQRPLPTNYLMGFYAGPPANSPDYQALRVAAAVLGGRMFTEIRTRRNLTYAVDAPFEEHAESFGGLYVTTVSPDTTLALMRASVRELQEGLLDPEGLAQIVQQFITDYFMSNETNAQQASFLARAALFEGDYSRAASFVDELQRVTPADVQRVARTYMHDVHWGYVGDTTAVTRERMKF